MIDAKELRIGNYVHRNDYPNDLFKMRSISDDRIHLINVLEIDVVNNTIYSSDCTLSELEPIPLTDKWLLKFGFEETLTKVYSIDDFPSYKFTGHSFEVFAFEENNYLPDLQYIHQLQNLYFALTGTELTLSHELA